ncbi:ATP-binding protein, partial [Pseudoclavibacter helvolus]
MSQKFSVTDYKGARDVSIETTAGELVIVAGRNGSGKSSFIDGISELFDPHGVKLTPKPIRDGADSAQSEFIDEALGIRLVRTWKKNDAGKLEAYALDGAKYS